MKLVPGVLLSFLFLYASGADSLPSGRARVAYVTSTAIYLDAGTEAGLHKGAKVEVLRGEAVVARLVVTELSSKRAACPAPDSVKIETGDVVRFEPMSEPSASVPSRQVSPRPDVVSPASRASRESPWRGRLGVRFLALTGQVESDQSYYQPALDARVEGSLGKDLGVSLDARTHRTYRALSDGTESQEGRARVYRLYARWQRLGSGWSVVAGRQHSEVPAVGIFDGLTVEYGRNPWRVGVLSGTPADPVHFDFPGGIREHGLYFGLENPSGAPGRWRLTVALMGSYEENQIDRESAALKAFYQRGRFSGVAVQEIDLNRGWKRDEESLVTLTSSFVSARFAATRTVTLDGGFDTRRRVRFYRNRITPETEFDDAHRRGFWGGVRWRALRRLDFSVSARRSSGGDSGVADAVTLTMNAGIPQIPGSSARARATWYASERASGRFFSLTVGMSPTDRLHAELTGGIRDEGRADIVVGPNDLHWVSVDVDYQLSRPWYAVLSVESTNGERESLTQYYSSLVYRF